MAALKHVLAQLKTMGIQRVKLTGGEPYVREDIDDVIAHCSRLDLDVTLCSNGTLLDDQRIRVLHQANGKIKVGLHGTPELHDTLVGAHVAHQVHSNIVRCLQVGVKLSIHTLLTRMSDPMAVIDYMIDFCVSNGISKLSFIPFVPRGRGRNCSTAYALDSQELTTLQEYLRQVAGKRPLDIRYIDLWTKAYYTVETDGSAIWSKETEDSDSFIEPLWEGRTNEDS